MLKKYLIATIAGLLFTCSTNGMSHVERFKATVPGLGVLYGAYCTKSLNCFNMPEGPELEKYPELAKFIARYRCSQELESNRARHFLKNDVSRLINAERMKQIIEQEKLDRFKVPSKCLCRVNDHEYRTLSTRMEWQAPTFRCDLSLAEVQQAAWLVKKTGYSDWNPGNIKRTIDGHIGICDTEDASFSERGKAYRALQTLNKPGRMITCEAHTKAWLDKFIAEDHDIPPHKGLGSDPTYDTDIDFEKVKKQLYSFESDFNRTLS